MLKQSKIKTSDNPLHLFTYYLTKFICPEFTLEWLNWILLIEGLNLEDCGRGKLKKKSSLVFIHGKKRSSQLSEENTRLRNYQSSRFLEGNTHKHLKYLPTFIRSGEWILQDRYELCDWQTWESRVSNGIYFEDFSDFLPAKLIILSPSIL